MATRQQFLKCWSGNPLCGGLQARSPPRSPQSTKGPRWSAWACLFVRRVLNTNSARCVVLLNNTHCLKRKNTNACSDSRPPEFLCLYFLVGSWDDAQTEQTKAFKIQVFLHLGYHFLFFFLCYCNRFIQKRNNKTSVCFFLKENPDSSVETASSFNPWVRTILRTILSLSQSPPQAWNLNVNMQGKP